MNALVGWLVVLLPMDPAPASEDRITDGSSRALLAPAPSDGEQAREAARPRERYLLLDNDRISAGLVSEEGDDYVVERRGARIVVPKRRTKLVADSLDEVYRYRSQRIPVNDVPMRAEFARWCFEQGLVDFAISEAKLVLSLDPENEPAKRVMRLAQPPAPTARDQRVASTASATSKRLRQPDPTRVVSQFKSAYGQDLFDGYKRMEPLLRGSCGSSACHGSRHDGPFRIYSRTNSNGTDIGLTARNLTSMLDSIDYRDPQRSPLLYKSLERHGSSSLPPLSGVQDPTYIQLQEWVHEIARRWSGNEIPLEVAPGADPNRSEEEEDSFAGQRRLLEPRTYVRRTGRPSRPMMAPGDEPQMMRSGIPVADDAPAPPVEAMPEPSAEDTNSIDQGTPERSTSEGGWPEQRPTKPKEEKISPQEMAQPVSAEPSLSPAPTPGPMRRAMNRFVELVGGRPRVRMSIPIQGDKKGDVFQAAPPSIGLQEDFLKSNEVLDQGTNTPTP